MDRIVEFLDYANLQAALRDYEADLDCIRLRDFLAADRFLLDVFVYLPVSPYQPEKRLVLARALRREGFFVRTKIGKKRPDLKWKCNMDVELTLDVLEYTRHARVDTMIVGTGDGDFIALANEIRSRGIRIEVASTEATSSAELREAASGFIDLAQFAAEQHALDQPAAVNGLPGRAVITI